MQILDFLHSDCYFLVGYLENLLFLLGVSSSKGLLRNQIYAM